MNSIAHHTESAAPAMLGITIIYEDLETGLRGKSFSDRLTAALGGEPDRAPACWRGELLELPEVAAEIARDAAMSEFIILSLRGDRNLSVMTKWWIESWLEEAAGGRSSLIALYDPARSTAAHAESSRCYLRYVAVHAGVAFFAHCAAGPEDRIDPLPENEEPFAPRRLRRRSRRASTPIFPTAASA